MSGFARRLRHLFVDDPRLAAACLASVAACGVVRRLGLPATPTAMLLLLTLAASLCASLCFGDTKR